jgi:hypothetical protein
LHGVTALFARNYRVAVLRRLAIVRHKPQYQGTMRHGSTTRSDPFYIVFFPQAIPAIYHIPLHLPQTANAGRLARRLSEKANPHTYGAAITQQPPSGSG